MGESRAYEVPTLVRGRGLQEKWALCQPWGTLLARVPQDQLGRGPVAGTGHPRPAWRVEGALLITGGDGHPGACSHQAEVKGETTEIVADTGLTGAQDSSGDQDKQGQEAPLSKGSQEAGAAVGVLHPAPAQEAPSVPCAWDCIAQSTPASFHTWPFSAFTHTRLRSPPAHTWKEGPQVDSTQ